MRLILTLGLVLALSGPLLRGAAKATTTRAAPVLTDPQLEQAIRARFAKSKIREEKFQVRVQNGVAIIEGKTKVIQRKATATRLARLAGARAVKNRVEVDEEARNAALENLEKGRRRAQVKRSEVRSEGPGR